MINTSNEYKNFIREDRRFSMKATIAFEDNTVIEVDDSRIFQDGMSFDNATSGINEFQIGSAIIGKHKLTLDNSDGYFDTYEFASAEVVPLVGLELSETTEYLKKGIYTVDDYSFQGSIISLECLDNMHKFEIPFSRLDVGFPVTALGLLQAVSTYCGVSIATPSFTNSDFIIQERPDSAALSCLDIVAYIAQLSGNFAKVNINGDLELKWYDTGAFEQADNLDGGIFDSDTPYSTGDNADGGDFTFSETEHYDGGTFKQMDRYHHFYFFSTTPSVAIDDVVITGIQAENTIDYEEEYSVLFGSQGYILNLSNNPLIQSESDATTIVNTVGAKIVGMRFRPFSANILSDPSVEAGDPCYISVRTSRGYNTYQSFVTMQSYTVAQSQGIECNAETLSRKNSTIYSADTKAIVQARKQARQEVSAYDLEQQRFNNLVFHSFGLYRTEELLEDGSTIEYAHDKPTLAESINIWRQSADTFVVSNDGGQTWRGMDADGNIIANVLNAVGVNAGWIRTGLLEATSGASRIDMETGEVNLGWGAFRTYKDSNALWKSEFSGDLFASRIESSSALSVYIPLHGGPRMAFRFYAMTPDATSPGTAQIDSDMGSIDFGKAITVYGSDSWREYGSVIHGGLEVFSGDFTVSGAKNRKVQTSNYNKVLLNAYETPRPTFADTGHGTISEDGLCYVDIGPVFLETIDQNHEYTHFLTKYGQGDLWIRKDLSTKEYFVVEGTPNLEFSWKIEAIQKGYNNYRLEKSSDRFGDYAPIDYESSADTYLSSYEEEITA